MKIALVHMEYRYDHLQKVKAEMQELGAPEIRAIWVTEKGMWAALEGCHRTRAARELGLTPTIKEVEYVPGMSWFDCGMGAEYVAAEITVDEVVANAGNEHVIGFGEDALPHIDDVRRPQEGEVLKYRIIKNIGFDFGTGRIYSGIGAEFTSEDTGGKDVTDYVSLGYLEIVEGEPAKQTKPAGVAPKRKYQRRG